MRKQARQQYVQHATTLSCRQTTQTARTLAVHKAKMRRQHLVLSAHCNILRTRVVSTRTLDADRTTGTYLHHTPRRPTQTHWELCEKVVQKSHA